MALSKRDRVQAALRGAQVDRVPMSFWGHDYRREWSAEGLAEATLESYQRYDWDFVKVNPRASYLSEAWGAAYRPSGNEHQSPILTEPVVKSAADLDGIKPLEASRGAFGEQIQALRLIARGLAGEAPFIQTIFCPLGVLGQLTGGDAQLMRSLIREAPQEVHRALAAISGTLAGYAALCLEAGACGIFFATLEWASQSNLDIGDYLQFGRPYDLQVLKSTSEASFNVLHVCKKRNMLASILDYPVHLLHWDATDASNPSLREIQAMTDKAVMGGINQETTLLNGSPAQVAAEVQEALDQTNGQRFLLGPGCSISPQTPKANLEAAREALDAYPALNTK